VERLFDLHNQFFETAKRAAEDFNIKISGGFAVR
jgi:hypothetical protein